MDPLDPVHAGGRFCKLFAAKVVEKRYYFIFCFNTISEKKTNFHINIDPNVFDEIEKRFGQ